LALLPTGEVPQAHGLVFAPRCQHPAIHRERDGRHIPLWPVRMHNRLPVAISQTCTLPLPSASPGGPPPAARQRPAGEKTGLCSTSRRTENRRSSRPVFGSHRRRSLALTTGRPLVVKNWPSSDAANWMMLSRYPAISATRRPVATSHTRIVGSQPPVEYSRL